MSNTQVANEQTWSGSLYYNYSAMLTPGNHTIEAFVSSQDIYEGPTQDSWITVMFFFNNASIAIPF